MQSEFPREALKRLPLAEAVLTLWQWVAECTVLNTLFERFRGRCYEHKIGFSLMVQLVADALLQHAGSANQSFSRSRQGGELEATIQAAYAKLRNLPPELSQAFLGELTGRLLEIMPPLARLELPASIAHLEPIVVDGKVVKRVPKRLRPLRGAKGGALGGKGLVGLHLRHGLALTLAAHPDGHTNDAKLVPTLVPLVRQQLPGKLILWIADRQFCDLTQTVVFTEGDDAFLVRYHTRVGFFPDLAQPARQGTDSQGRAYREEWGWLGGPKNPKRRLVRRITLQRPGQASIILVTSLLDADRVPARDLLDLYLRRWGIERVFQKITDVFHLEHLIGSSPEGTLFQLAFCLLLYNLIQVVRGYVAVAQARPIETISTENLFYDVHRQLVALHEVVPVDDIDALFTAVPTAAQVRQRLSRLLGSVWSELWVKAPSRKRKPKTTAGKREHMSVYRVLRKDQERKHRQAKAAAG